MGWNFETFFRGSGRSITRSGRVSAEAVFGLSVMALTVMVFGLVVLARGERETAKMNGSPSRARPHEAMAFSSPSASAANSQSDTRSTAVPANSDTITRDGVTVVSPPLLVPVVNLDERSLSSSPAKDDDDGGSVRKHSATRKHRHYAARTHSRRNTEYRIVGLAANRRLVVVRR